MMAPFVSRAVARVMCAAAGVFALTYAVAQAGERDQLNVCRAMVAQSQHAGTSQDGPALTRCRQIIKEWAWRDARTTVDEDGRPLR
jgi:hypothetical protein